MAVEMERESLITEAPNAPVTAQRRVRSDLENSLPKPCKSLHLLKLLGVPLSLESRERGMKTYIRPRYRIIYTNFVQILIIYSVIRFQYLLFLYSKGPCHEYFLSILSS